MGHRQLHRKDTTKFGWEVQDKVLSPAIHSDPPTLPHMMKEISCVWTSEKACSNGVCVAVKASTCNALSFANVCLMSVTLPQRGKE